MWIYQLWQSLRIRMAMTFGLLATLVALCVQSYVSHQVYKHEVAERAETLTAMARSVAAVISENLEQRQHEVAFASSMPSVIGEQLDVEHIRTVLLQLQANFHEYAWIGLADAKGQVLVSATGVLEGESVAQRPWFTKAKDGFYMGDLHDAKLLANHLRTRYGDEPARLLDFAYPVRGQDGLVRGVLGAHVHWRWARDLLSRVQESKLVSHGVELVIAQSNGTVIYPEQEFGRSVIHVLDQLQNQSLANSLVDGRPHFYAAVALTGHEAQQQIGWSVLVRQSSEDVLKGPRQLTIGLWFIWAIGAGVAALVAYFVARQISRPIERLAAHVRDVQQVPAELDREFSGTRELAGLYEALRERDAELGRQRDELTQNALMLEHRVEQRTVELQAANDELQRIAQTDALTGISNRGHINSRLQQEFLRYIRHQHPYCVLVMDIDHFKLVNDEHGHAMGDHVLVQAAHLLESSVRSSDFVGRFGGEEFLALLPNATAGSAVLVADKIVQAVRAFDFGAVGLITISVGVAEVAPEDVQYEDVIRRADAALYRAKSGGRDRAWLA